MKGRTTAWPTLVEGGRWGKWRGSNPRANQQLARHQVPLMSISFTYTPDASAMLPEKLGSRHYI